MVLCRSIGNAQICAELSFYAKELSPVRETALFHNAELSFYAKELSPVRETALFHNMAIIYSAVWSAPCRKLSNSVPNRLTLSSISFSMPFQKNCITKPMKA